MPRRNNPRDRASPNMKQAGAWIRAVREKRGLSQEEVAHLAGMSRNTLQKYEAGRVTKIEELGAILQALGLPLDQLLLGLRMAAESDAGDLPAGALSEPLRAADPVPYGVGDTERLQAGLVRMIEASFPDPAKRAELLKHLLAVVAAYIG